MNLCLERPLSAFIDRDAHASRESETRHPHPQNDDVVVAREAWRRVHYTVRQLPGIVQFSAAVLDDAARLARRFAKAHGVDVWYSEGGAYQLLESNRQRM